MCNAALLTTINSSKAALLAWGGFFVGLGPSKYVGGRGGEVCAVAPANTSRTCPKCEDVSPLNPSGSAVESAVLRTTPPSWTPTTYSGAPGLRACGERLCTARAQVKRSSRKSRAGQQQKPSEEIPMRLKTHKDSAGNLRPSGRRGCQIASASIEPKVIFLPLQNKRTCIAESSMLECSSTHSLRGCAPQCGYVQMHVLQNFA